jgi:hypothetical protein
MQKYLASLCLLVLLSSCRSGSSNMPTLESIAQNRLHHYDWLMNSAQTHAVAVAKAPAGASGLTDYLIFDVKQGKLLAEGSFRPGYIRWLNNDEIEIFDAPGMVRPDEDLARFKKIIQIKNLP